MRKTYLTIRLISMVVMSVIAFMPNKVTPVSGIGFAIAGRWMM